MHVRTAERPDQNKRMISTTEATGERAEDEDPASWSNKLLDSLVKGVVKSKILYVGDRDRDAAELTVRANVKALAFELQGRSAKAHGGVHEDLHDHGREQGCLGLR